MFLSETFNSLSEAPTTQNGQTLKQFVGKTDDLFEYVWPFCGVDA